MNDNQDLDRRKSEFGARLTQRMGELGIRQIDVVNLTKAGSGSISSWTAGKNIPRRGWLVKLAEVLETTPDWLLNGDPITDDDTDTDTDTDVVDAAGTDDTNDIGDDADTPADNSFGSVERIDDDLVSVDEADKPSKKKNKKRKKAKKAKKAKKLAKQIKKAQKSIGVISINGATVVIIPR